ncbi:MAG: hypothetical protein ACKOSS_05700 [Planctomycetia bacterium]
MPAAPAVATAPAAPSSTATPAVASTPATPSTPAAPSTLAAPSVPLQPAAPLLPAPGAPSAPIVERMDPAPVPGAIARIVQVSTEHNVALDDGTFALALRTTFTVDAPEGGTFRVWVSFVDQASGSAIRATRASFAKPDGQAHVVTQPVSCLAGGETFEAPLLVPYVIFPNPGAGQSSEVLARIEVTREAGGQREVVVASSLTTFRVHGS